MTFARSSGGIPGPSSSTMIETVFRPWLARTRTAVVPPADLSALSIRFAVALASRSLSPSVGGSPSQSMPSAMPPAAAAAS